MKKTSLLFAVTAILILSSCSIQKRHYMNGYAFTWNSRHAENKKTELKPEEDAVAQQEFQNDTTEAELSASIQALPSLPAKAPSFFKAAKKPAGDSCDIIDFKDHQRMLVKVLEIDQLNIKYRKCSDVNAPEQVVSKSKVNYIQFSNGLKEMMPVMEEVPTVKKVVPLKPEKITTEPQDHISAKMSWIFGICAYVPIVGWIFALMAIVHGVIALTAINNKPEKYKGETQAIVGILLGILGLIAGAIAVFLTLGPGSVLI